MEGLVPDLDFYETKLAAGTNLATLWIEIVVQ